MLHKLVSRRSGAAAHPAKHLARAALLVARTERAAVGVQGDRPGCGRRELTRPARGRLTARAPLHSRRPPGDSSRRRRCQCATPRTPCRSWRAQRSASRRRTMARSGAGLRVCRFIWRLLGGCFERDFSESTPSLVFVHERRSSQSTHLRGTCPVASTPPRGRSCGRSPSSHATGSRSSDVTSGTSLERRVPLCGVSPVKGKGRRRDDGPG